MSASRAGMGAAHGLSVIALALLACGGSEEDFPRHFRWGTAISGFQVEMGCPTLPPEECEDPNSDWYAWITAPELQADPATHLSGDAPSRGPGHWELYSDDYRRAREELSTNALRLGIEWSRLFPSSTAGIEGHEALRQIANLSALEHYRAQMVALRERGLTPLVTLNHYTLPSWLHDAVGCHVDLSGCTRRGWLDRQAVVAEIAKYAGFVARELGAEVDRWATLNEPMAVIVPGYLFPSADRSNPPGVFFEASAAREAMMAMIEAHARMYDAVRAADEIDADGDGVAAEIGLVLAMVPVRAKDPSRSLDVAAARNVFYLYHSVFLNAAIRGELDEGLDRQTVPRSDLGGRMDFLGVNYYTRMTVAGTETPSLPQLSPLTNFDPFDVSAWETYPAGLHEMLMEAKGYGVPIYVTENGTAAIAEPEGGLDYLVPHITWVRRAIRDGADVRGYFWWSLIDNYEWNHGMNMRFGLYAIDAADPAKERTPRPAAGAFRRIAAGNRVPDDLARRYPAPEP